MLEVVRAALSVQSKVSKKVAWVGLIDWVWCIEQMGNNIFLPNQNPPFEVCTDRLGAVLRCIIVGLIDWMRCVEQMGNNIFFTNQNPPFEVCADQDRLGVVHRCICWTDRLGAVHRTNGKQCSFSQSKSNI